MYGPKPQSPTSFPIPTSPKRGHRFDEAVAARHQRAQSSGSRSAAQTTSLTSKAVTNATALRLISEKKAQLADAKTQASAANRMYQFAHNEVFRLGRPVIYEDSDEVTDSDYEENRERQEAEEREKEAEKQAKIADAVSRDRFAALQAVAASLGHPNAAQDGNWSIMSESEQEALFHRLENECHDYGTLTDAGYKTGMILAPRADPKDRKRRAVAIDCEFVGVMGDISVLAQVCAVDALTGEVLLDFLVEPGHRRVNYRTRYSGLTNHTFHRYRETGLVLPDVAAAQEALFEFMDRDTILVGFAMDNDLEVLGISHWRVFDAQVAAREAEFRASGVRPKRWSLQSLCRQFLGRTVQRSSRGHDCLEDVFAARELMLWWVKEENEDRVEEWVQVQVDRDNDGTAFDIQNWL